jgi:hypothetical protein
MSMTMIAGSSPVTRLVSRPTSEAELIARLVSSVSHDGLCVDPVWIVNCYVALKSRPLIILAGPRRSGKELLVRNLVQILTSDARQSQAMLGHAWWAEGTGNAALFTEAQVRLNSSKILALIEQASLPDNSRRLFIGWLNHIGPAELAGFFSELAYQLQHRRLVQLPSFHLTEPVACPPNFSLIGTIDALPFSWPNGDPFSETVIVPWPAVAVRPPAGRRSVTPGLPSAERLFLSSCIRSEKAAFDKLHHIQGWRPQLMWPLVVVEDLLRRHGAALSDWAMGEAMIYVANAWSADGRGLFDPAPGRNLAIALDFAVAQSLLLPAGESIQRSPALYRRLAGALTGGFPRSAGFLHALQPAPAVTAAPDRSPRDGPRPVEQPASVTARPRTVVHLASAGE